jgi:hypothetical protein
VVKIWHASCTTEVGVGTQSCAQLYALTCSERGDAHEPFLSADLILLLVVCRNPL